MARFGEYGTKVFGLWYGISRIKSPIGGAPSGHTLSPPEVDVPSDRLGDFFQVAPQ
jgi:hypothetical protein